MASSLRLDVSRLLGLLRKSEPSKKTNKITADVIGSIVKTINASGGGASTALADAEFTYDGSGNLTRIDYANGGYKEFTYDGSGNLQTLFNGSIKKTFSYDGSGNLIDIEIS